MVCNMNLIKSFWRQKKAGVQKRLQILYILCIAKLLNTRYSNYIVMISNLTI